MRPCPIFATTTTSAVAASIPAADYGKLAVLTLRP